MAGVVSSVSARFLRMATLATPREESWVWGDGESREVSLGHVAFEVPWRPRVSVSNR